MAGRVVNPTPYQSENQQHKTVNVSYVGNGTFSISPGKDFKIRLQYGRITVVTDATVADRKFLHCIKDRNDNILNYGTQNTTAITATQTKSLSLHSDSTQVGIGHANVDLANLMFPDIHIYETDKYVLSLGAGVAGDTVTGYIKLLRVPVNRRFNE